MSEALSHLPGLMIVLPIYFLPAILAFLFGRHNAVAILAANLLFGWTFFGWGICLVWFFMKPAPPRDPWGERRFTYRRQTWPGMGDEPIQKRSRRPDNESENMAFHFLMDPDTSER